MPSLFLELFKHDHVVTFIQMFFISLRFAEIHFVQDLIAVKRNKRQILSPICLVLIDLLKHQSSC